MHFWKNRYVCGWQLGVALGLFCLVIGAMQGQFEVMLRKAVVICMECIGIG